MYKIKLKKNYIPKVSVCGPVSFKLRDIVKQERKELENKKSMCPQNWIPIDCSLLNEAGMRPY